MADVEKRLADLEKRAKAAEGKLAAAGNGGSGSDDAATLKRLNEIRDAVLADQREAQTALAKSSDLEKEVHKLKEENEKLRYQVKHLKKSLDEKDP
jgi:hypothetical protein